MPHQSLRWPERGARRSLLPLPEDAPEPAPTMMTDAGDGRGDCPEIFASAPSGGAPTLLLSLGKCLYSPARKSEQGSKKNPLQLDACMLASSQKPSFLVQTVMWMAALGCLRCSIKSIHLH